MTLGARSAPWPPVVCFLDIISWTVSSMFFALEPWTETWARINLSSDCGCQVFYPSNRKADQNGSFPRPQAAPPFAASFLSLLLVINVLGESCTYCKCDLTRPYGRWKRAFVSVVREKLYLCSMRSDLENCTTLQLIMLNIPKNSNSYTQMLLLV